MVPSRSRRLVFQPSCYRSLQSGANLLVNAIRPTLGPLPRITAVDRLLDERSAERLDSGGVIAQRIVQIHDHDADVGAMLLREALWQLEDQEGDGTATAAVLFQNVFDEGVRHVAAGFNARILQQHLNDGMRLIIDQLTAMAQPVSGQEQISHIARTISHDPEVSQLLGEVFDIIGEYGRLEIRKGDGRELKREYVEGMYFDKGLMSREMITEKPAVRVNMDEPAIVISDLHINEPEELLPVLTCAIQNGVQKLIIMAAEIKGPAMAFLLANNKKTDEFQVISVRTPGYGSEEQSWAMTDMVALCGGRAFIEAAGDSLRTITPEHFGHARRAWAEFKSFGFVGGKGDPRKLRRHIAGLKESYDTCSDINQRKKLQARLGKLLGGSATVRIGGSTEPEIDERVEHAERTATAIRGALREGTVPGGGVALLQCKTTLQQRLQDASSDEEAASYRILSKALEAPTRVIAANAGYDPSDVMATLRLQANGAGFDVVSGQFVDMARTGIVDSASVTKAAVYAGISTAALALTIDVLVHRQNQPTRATPHTPGKRKQI